MRRVLMKRPLRVMIFAGPSGGHLFPAIAFAESTEVAGEITELNKNIYELDESVKELYEVGRKWSLEYFEEIKPDIVLLDLKMPDIDGVEVLKIIDNVARFVSENAANAFSYAFELVTQNAARLKLARAA